jgi:hypothetical protein
LGNFVKNGGCSPEDLHTFMVISRPDYRLEVIISCGVRDKTEEKVDDLNVTVEHDGLEISQFAR